MKRSLSPTLAAFGIVFVAFALRLYRLDSIPLRGDEAFTLQEWTRPLRTVLADVAPVDPQPPFAFASLRLWVTLAGTAPLAARFYSLLWSVLSIAPLYQLGRSMRGPRTGMLAALLWGISPFQVWHAQDIRNYTLWAAWSIMGMWLLVASLKTNRLGRRAAYIMVTALAAYSFYFEGFVILLHNAYALWCLRSRPRLLIYWVATQAALGGLLAPWYLQLPRLRAGGYGGTGLRLTGPAEVIAAVPETIRTLLFGETLPSGIVAVTTATLVALAALLAGIGLGLVLRKRQPNAFLLSGYVALPLTLFIALSTLGHYYRPRYLNGVAPAYTLALATIVVWPWGVGQHILRWSSRALLLAVLALDATALANLFYDPAYAKAPNWPALAATLEADVRESDVIIRNVPDPAFDYYYQGAASSVILPEEPDAPLSETANYLEPVFDQTSRVWFLPSEHPVWDPDQTVASYLESHHQLLADTRIDSFRLQLWAPWDIAENEIAHPAAWEIGQIARLVGFDTSPTTPSDTVSLTPGQSLILIVYWQPTGNSPVPYTVFTHLLGPQQADGSTQWAGDDHPPQNGHADTTRWSSRPIMRDSFVLTIPGDAPPGSYAVELGLYDPNTNQRLPVTHLGGREEGGRLVGDAIPLLTVRLVNP